MSQPVRKKFVSPYNSALDAEYKHIQRITTERRRISPKKGESWLIRILPAQLGDSGLWFARVAKHWLAKKPITCPRHTHPHYGGHPDAACPVCDVVEELNASSDENIRNKAWESRSTTQWLVYALVYEKTINGQEITLAPDEQMIPYEFQMYKGTWEELVSFFKAGGRPDNPLSVLDLIAGNDFMLTKSGNKPLRLDKQESRPILDDLSDPPEEDERVIRMMKACPAPRVVIPTDQQLNVFADKLHDFCLGDVGGGGDSSGDDQGPDEAVGSRSSTRGAAPRRRAEPAAETDGAEPDPEQAPAPARRPVAPAGRRASPPPPPPEPEPEADAGDGTGEVADGSGDEPQADGQDDQPMDETEGAEAPPPPPPTRRTAPAAPTTRTAPAAPARTAGRPAPAPAPARATKAPTGQIEDDPSDPLPDADKDGVDAADEPVAGTTTRRTTPAAPPAVGRAGGNAMRTSVASRVSAATAAAARGTVQRR